MDHHCCFSDRCVAYYSMKPFVIFTGSVVMLTVVGMSTIWANMILRVDETGEGLVSFTDLVNTIVF